jgi:hypothetical protein
MTSRKSYCNFSSEEDNEEKEARLDLELADESYRGWGGEG